MSDHVRGLRPALPPARRIVSHSAQRRWPAARTRSGSHDQVDAQPAAVRATRSLAKLKEVFHLTAVGLVLRAGQSAISFINVILLAHALGPVGRGEYFLFLAAVALLA